MNKICRIYYIENKINKYGYIGKAIDINKRIKEHIRKLRNNKHENIYLQRASDKYGEEKFSYHILFKLSKINWLLNL